MPKQPFCNSMVFLKGTGNSVGERQVVARKRATTVCRQEGMQMKTDMQQDWKVEWHEVKQVENELCQDTEKKITSVLSPWLSYVLLSDFYCCCVSPSLPVILVMFGVPRVPSENKAEDWTRHLYSGALMESLRLKWQEVKGERAESSREQQTAPHHCCCCRYAKPLDCDGMGSVCVCVNECFSLDACTVCVERARGVSERFLSTDDYGRSFAINSFCSQAFIFC